MLPAVFRPTSATFPAARTAAVSGSGEDAGAAGAACERSRGGAVAAGLRVALGFRFAAGAGRVLAFARVVATPRAPGPRFSLRCPGRDLGRFPSTPGSSVSSAATGGKIAPAAA